jgi:hypothetical protein
LCNDFGAAGRIIANTIVTLCYRLPWQPIADTNPQHFAPLRTDSSICRMEPKKADHHDRGGIR